MWIIARLWYQRVLSLMLEVYLGDYELRGDVNESLYQGVEQGLYHQS